MKKQFKILLTTDYSELSVSAQYYALRLAQNVKATLQILHVYSIPLGSTPADPFEFSKTRQDFKNSELRRLEQHKIQLFHSLAIDDALLSCECNVREGQIVKEILSEAKEWEADFLIIGTHGSSGLRNVIFGSHTWNLIKRSDVPVFAIPPNQNYAKIKSIVYAVEERTEELTALNFLIGFAKVFDADITLLHISALEEDEKSEEEIFEEFKSGIKRKNLYNRLLFKFKTGKNIETGLNESAAQPETDLLVMCPKKMSLLDKLLIPSVTKNMSSITVLPLLAIPDNYEITPKEEITFLD